MKHSMKHSIHNQTRPSVPKDGDVRSKERKKVDTLVKDITNALSNKDVRTLTNLLIKNDTKHIDDELLQQSSSMIMDSEDYRSMFNLYGSGYHRNNRSSINKLLILLLDNDEKERALEIHDTLRLQSLGYGAVGDEVKYANNVYNGLDSSITVRINGIKSINGWYASNHHLRPIRWFKI